MTDQIAPSLATELEQAAVREFERMCAEVGTAADDAEALGKLLTRAAALARAAEKLTTLLSDIAYSGPTSTVEAAVVAEFNLRALVSSEGKGE